MYDFPGSKPPTLRLEESGRGADLDARSDRGSCTRQEKNLDLRELCRSIMGIVIPADIRRRLDANAYFCLEQLMFDKAQRLGIRVSSSDDSLWGFQREED